MTVGAVAPKATESELVELAPGETMQVRLRIATGLRGGECISRLQVLAQALDGRNVSSAQLAVFTYVLVPMAAQPESSSFILNEEELSTPVKQTIALADLWPDGGVPIKTITSTLGDKLHYQLVPAHGEIGIGNRLLRKRYNLELSFSLDAAMTDFNHTVTITLDHPKAKPIEISLFGKIIPRCSLDTGSIAICGKKAGEQIVRRIEYHYRDPADRELRLVKAPAWLNGSVSEVRDGLKVLTLTCTLPERKGDQVEQMCVEYGRDKKRAVLPIFVSCQADSRSE